MTDTNELRKLLAAATPLPWYGTWSISTACGDPIANTDVSLASDPEESDANGELIVAAVNALPALLDELDAARAEVAEAKRLEGVRLAQIASLQEIIRNDTTPAGVEVARFRAEVERLREQVHCRNCGGTVGDHLAPDQGGCTGRFVIDGVEMVPTAKHTETP